MVIKSVTNTAVSTGFTRCVSLSPRTPFRLRIFSLLEMAFFQHSVELSQLSCNRWTFIIIITVVIVQFLRLSACRPFFDGIHLMLWIFQFMVRTICNSIFDAEKNCRRNKQREVFFNELNDVTSSWCLYDALRADVNAYTRHTYSYIYQTVGNERTINCHLFKGCRCWWQSELESY